MAAKSIGSGNPRAKIIFGISFQPEFKDKARISIFAVGCKEGQEKNPKPPSRKKPVKPKTKAQAKLPLAIPKKPASSADALTKSKEQEENKVVSPEGVGMQDPLKTRRNALDLKKAVEEEIQELEKKEKAWDIPSFLRNKPVS